MKIQCSCGAKFAFDVTPEMGQNPIRFVCQNCGLDSSDLVNELIRRELASAEAVPAAAPPEVVPPQEETKSTGTARIRVRASKPAAPSSPEGSPLPFCAKHPGQVPVDRCRVCGKPICPKCMELFGYLCSPLCLGKAETEGLDIPAYHGKKSAVQSRYWRKVGLVSGAIAAVVVGLLGLWFWYAWFGSFPKPVFSVRFPEPAYAGRSVECATNQLVFLHGGTLARYGVKDKTEFWSRSLIDPKEIDALVAQRIRNLQAAAARSEFGFKMPTKQEVIEDTKRFADASLDLRVRAHNIWVLAPVSLLSNDWKLVRYDWGTGRPLQEILLGARLARLATLGEELLLTVRGRHGGQAVTHINLLSGEWRVDRFILPSAQEAAAASARKPGSKPVVTSSRGAVPLDPVKVEEQVQHLSLPAQIALPATLSSELHQERIMRELDEDSGTPPRPRGQVENEPSDPFTLIPCRDGYVQFGVELLEERLNTRNAVKAAPTKSVLDGNLTASKSVELANEIANEIQRERGGATVTEDESLYQVTLRRPELKDAPDWVGEVIGPPSFIPLKTVNVVPAGKMVVVLDKLNKKLWQANLTYKVQAGPALIGEEPGPYGEGPCVERGDALYVIDEGVVTAFELKTGKARWRLPSVGTAGVFFDDDGMMYVNTSTASPERIKYSLQIDFTDKASVVVFKIDPRTGKTLWAAAPGAFISYVSGKFIYLMGSHVSEEREDSVIHPVVSIPSYFEIQRLNPRNGHPMWSYPYRELRAPLDVRFNGNRIELVFKKEVEVLKYFSF